MSEATKIFLRVRQIRAEDGIYGVLSAWIKNLQVIRNLGHIIGHDLQYLRKALLCVLLHRCSLRRALIELGEPLAKQLLGPEMKGERYTANAVVGHIHTKTNATGFTAEDAESRRRNRSPSTLLRVRP